MAKRFFLRATLRGYPDEREIEVREDEVDRLRDVLSNVDASPLDGRAFFVCDSLSGRTIAINLQYVQAVRYLWDVSGIPSDAIRNDGPVEICLRGRTELLEVDSGDPVDLYDFFTGLEMKASIVPFPEFTDIDGEMIQFNRREVIWVSAPTHLLFEGKRLMLEEDGLED